MYKIHFKTHNNKKLKEIHTFIKRLKIMTIPTFL